MGCPQGSVSSHFSTGERERAREGQGIISFYKNNRNIDDVDNMSEIQNSVWQYGQ
jgi:hypothetical protein